MSESVRDKYGNMQTEVWNLYELGKQYNMQLVPNQYNLVDTNIEFFTGNQWKGLSESSAMAALPKPVFNIIKRVGALFVASLTSSASKVSFEPLTNKQEGAPVETPEGQELIDEQGKKAAQMATDEVANLFEKFKMDAKIREALFDGVQTGDYCAHFYFDANAKPYGGTYGKYKGEIKMELVDGINIMFGNPNTREVEAQPYILVIGRDTVENLRREYLQYHPGKELESEVIQPDKDNMYQAGSGGKTELGTTDRTGKAIFIYYYTKCKKKVALTDSDGKPKMERVVDKDGNFVVETLPDGFPMTDAFGKPIYKERQAEEEVTTVHVSKYVQFTDIFDDIDTDLTYYPIAWGNWETQKNQYHGRALVTEIIPNQIYINTMFALVMRHQQLLGFPKILYDANVVGQWDNRVGQALAVHDLPPDRRMGDLYSVIQPADMSTQIMNCIDKAVQYTKECLGATDAQLGNVRPDNTSAIIALQSSSQVPLENPQSNKYAWLEDIGRILLDMMGTYYGERPVVTTKEEQVESVDPATGMPTTITKRGKVVELYNFRKFKDLWLNVRADVGASTYWSRIAMVQTLDNLKMNGVLDTIDYLERMPEEYVPRKEELLSKLRGQVEQQTASGMTPLADPEGTVPAKPAAASPGPDASSPKSAANGALVAAMPENIQELFHNLGTRSQKTLLRQTRLNTPGL